MKGFDVLSFDGDRAGTVVERQGDYLIVEHGSIFKHRRGLPTVFATVDESERVVRTTLSRSLIESAPNADDDFDERATARHYGLAAGEDSPETVGYGDLAPNDPARTAEEQNARSGLPSSAEQRAAAHGKLGAGEGPNDGP